MKLECAHVHNLQANRVNHTVGAKILRLVHWKKRILKRSISMRCVLSFGLKWIFSSLGGVEYHRISPLKLRGIHLKIKKSYKDYLSYYFFSGMILVCYHPNYEKSGQVEHPLRKF